MNAVLVISARDNVATALEPLDSGRRLDIGASTLVASEPIPRGHKIALRDIAAGEAVVKYGSPIGTATSRIRAGAHVHIHNVASTRGRGDLATDRRADTVPPDRAPRIAEPPDGVATEPAEERQRP